VTLVRVVQEAVQNAVKHGRSRRIAVHLRGSPTDLVLTVSDDGVGFDPGAAQRNGLGLISMAERIEAIGGTLDIRSAPRLGTALTVAVPLAGTSAASPMADAPRQTVA
jgi:signal transduction histidine kinase